MNNSHIILPILLLLFVLLAFYFKKESRHKRNIRTARKVQKKLSQIKFPGAKLNYLRKIDPFVFEELILNGFKNNGYKIKRNKRYTGDGGIDGRVKKDGQWFLVQAKRYSNCINPTHVTEFMTIVEMQKVAGGFFVHTGRTGKKSYELKNKSIDFISGDKLLALLQSTNPN